MRVPFLKEMRIGAYILKQKLLGRQRYPLVLMLEPLFRCNLACVGCGKIDYPDPILNRRLTVKPLAWAALMADSARSNTPSWHTDLSWCSLSPSRCTEKNK